ncbi:hypothetical protein K431DRAFT_308437 [Polychaeton citri CBS 116435]|uniref:Uncharacterized protein n=1 Tax=Polychaeton citri CBS 116435 TaxID=1314669 RepID=A0A9P4PVN7_9PEZI|nr:hypothetical protein K431DRAFT_308437 [Polychaeton citri CBS 116435]
MRSFIFMILTQVVRKLLQFEVASPGFSVSLLGVSYFPSRILLFLYLSFLQSYCKLA